MFETQVDYLLNLTPVRVYDCSVSVCVLTRETYPHSYRETFYLTATNSASSKLSLFTVYKHKYRHFM